MGARKRDDSLHRALDVAATLFVQHRFEDVPMGEIARLAHCSTATLYEVYGNKAKLYEASMQRVIYSSIPCLAGGGGHRGLRALLELESGRVESMSRRTVRSVFRALLRQPEIIGPTLYPVVREVHRETECAVLPLVVQAITEGSLRVLSAEVICADVISLGTYESVTKPLLFGMDEPMPTESILRMQFMPIVTAQGSRVLEDFLAALPQRAVSAA